jgi:DNA-directed RNA polymerase subunit RPC12/RpoP
VEVRESTYVTVQCGKCATLFETFIGFRTARCKNCGHVCRLDQAAEAAPNVTPIRRKASG